MVDGYTDNSRTLGEKMPTFFLIVGGNLESCGIASMSCDWTFRLYPIVDYDTIM